MFDPITITDDSGDDTTVEVEDGDIVRIKVEDQVLAEYLAEEDDSHAYAIGTYTLAQARQLRDALDAAIADIEAHTPGEDVYELVDREGYLWLYVANLDRWVCAMDLGDEDDSPTTGAAVHSVWRGFDEGAAAVIQTYGIRS